GLPTDIRKVPKEGNVIYGLMAAFFQSPREAPPAPRNQVTPVQAMLMMGSPFINIRVDAAKAGRVQKLLESGKTDLNLSRSFSWPPSRVSRCRRNFRRATVDGERPQPRC